MSVEGDLGLSKVQLVMARVDCYFPFANNWRVGLGKNQGSRSMCSYFVPPLFV